MYKAKYQVQEKDLRNFLSKYILADGFNLSLNLEKSKGLKVYDNLTNTYFLDFFSCFASMPLGYNHPKMIDDEFVNYLGKCSLNKPSNSDLYSIEYATFVNTFSKIAVRNHFNHLFFIDGGALANENALKVAFDWKVRKNLLKGYKEEKGYKVIYFNQAFHGRSGYTLSLTNTLINKVKYFPKFDWLKAHNPKIIFPIDKNLEQIKIEEQKSLDQIKKYFIDYKDEISSIIIEPIQAEGGDNHFRKEFLQELKNICLENDALLIFDEVQTGVGITGTFWVWEQLGLKPDIAAFGKKMQTCGIMVGERVDEITDNVFKVSSRINSTWGGNLTDMVRATKYLEIIEEENILENVKSVGKYILDELMDYQDRNNWISNSRGRGLMIAFDIEKEKRELFINKCFENKLLILACGENSIRFRPALNITKKEATEGLEIIFNVLNEIFNA